MDALASAQIHTAAHLQSQDIPQIEWPLLHFAKFWAKALSDCLLEAVESTMARFYLLCLPIPLLAILIRLLISQPFLTNRTPSELLLPQATLEK